MKPKSRILSLLLAICLVAGLMPTTAFAAGTDTGKAIQFVDSGTAANISGGQADNIYFGTYQQSSDGSDGYNTDPIKWRVLSMNGNSGTYSDGTKTVDANNAMFLLSDGLLGTGTYGGVYFQQNYHSASGTYHKGSAPTDGNHTNCQIANAWQDSDAQEWCETFYSNNLTAQEKGAVLATTKSDKAFTSSTYNIPFAASNNILNGDKVFFLSAEEAETGDYGFGSDNDRKANYGSSAGCWWLRSPYADSAGTAGFVFSDGSVYGDYVSSGWAARPAFNVNLKSVLFTSAAVGGKSSGTVDADVLQSVSEYTGNEWKLTLLDEDRSNFSASTSSQTTVNDNYSDWKITLNYENAMSYDAETAPNEYISVIIADSNGSALYYGRVAQPDSANGQVEIKIPDSLAAGKYTLNVFSEQYNGDYMTDYASAFAEVALTVEEAAAPGIDTGKAIQLVDSGTAANISGGQADNIYFGTYQQSSDGSVDYNTDPIKWRVLSNASGQLLLLSDQNLDVFQYHTDKESVTWETSTMRSWLNGYGVSENIGGDSGTDYTSDNFIGTAFSEKEQGAIADTTVVNDDNPTYGTEGGENTNDKIFLLSIAEANNGSYFANDSSRIATNTAYVADGGKIGSKMYGVGKADNWWLRSPGYYGYIAAYVMYNGGVRSFGPNVDFVITAVRPAFNLDLNSVLFTSAAAGGKSSGAEGGGNQGGEAADAIFEIGDYDGNEWKLTLLDNSRNFVVTEKAASGKPGDTITLNYTGATTGENEYISVIIADENGAQYYGRVAQPGGESGTATLSIPADLAPGSYTLNVFSEQYNGDYKTDYASAFDTVTLTVVDTTAPTLTAGSATRDSETAAKVKFTSSEAGTYYYAVVESGATAPNIDMDKEGTDCVAGENTISISDLTDTAAKDIYIVAKDAAGNVSQSLKIEIPAYTVIPATGGGGGSTTDYYRLTFETNGGSEIRSIRRAEYTTIDLTDYTPTREGYEFTGWYADENLTEKITSIRLTRNTTVYAGWEEIKENPSTGFENPFTDVSESDWFFNDVKFVYQNGLMNGTSATTFSPEGTTSRGMIVTILWRMAGSPDMEDKIWGYPFADVDATAYYGTAVYWARLNGIAGGYDDATFGPNAPINREQMAAILYRYAQYKGYDVSAKADLNKFTDADEISNYALEALQWANAEGLINGKGDGVLDPKGQATRAEAAAILMRFNEVVAE